MSKNNLKKLTILTGGLFGLSLVSLGISYLPKRKAQKHKCNEKCKDKSFMWHYMNLPWGTPPKKNIPQRLKSWFTKRFFKKYFAERFEEAERRRRSFSRGGEKYQQLMNIGWKYSTTWREEIAQDPQYDKKAYSPFNFGAANPGKDWEIE